MVLHTSPAPLTRRPDQEATEVRVGGERGHSAPAPMTDGVHKGGGTPDAAQEASEEEKLERASSACGHEGGIKVAARNLLAKPRSVGNDET